MGEQHIILIGEVMVELSMSHANPDQAGLGFAGDTFNTAVYLKRALPDARVSYATKLGPESFSDRIVDIMRDEGLETDLVLRSPDRNAGLYAITTDAKGERTFSYWRSASAARDLLRAPALTPDHLARADLVYLSAISLAILPPSDRSQLLAWLAAYRQAGGRLAFDSNYRPALWESRDAALQTIAAAWRMTDIGLPSVDDEMALFEDPDADAVLTRLHGYGLRSGALKRGAAGPLSLGAAIEQDYPAATRVVDSTAAGDSFNAAYLAARLSQQPEAACLMAGHALAAQVIGARGAILPRGTAA